MIFDLLPVMMLAKKDVAGHKVNYEDYLIELLNNSLSFSNKLEGQKFKAITSQSNGECDAIAGDYSIDFKLMIPTDFMMYKTKALPDINYLQLPNGFISVNDNEKSIDLDLQTKASSSFNTFIAKMITDGYEDLQKAKDDKKNILHKFINNLLVDKNLLIFLPATINRSLSNINIINKLFSNIFSFRNNIDKETFLTYLYGDYFIILSYKDGVFKIFDKVHKLLVKTFKDLYRLTYFI